MVRSEIRLLAARCRCRGLGWAAMLPHAGHVSWLTSQCESDRMAWFQDSRRMQPNLGVHPVERCWKGMWVRVKTMVPSRSHRYGLWMCIFQLFRIYHKLFLNFIDVHPKIYSLLSTSYEWNDINSTLGCWDDTSTNTIDLHPNTILCCLKVCDRLHRSYTVDLHRVMVNTSIDQSKIYSTYYRSSFPISESYEDL